MSSGFIEFLNSLVGSVALTPTQYKINPNDTVQDDPCATPSSISQCNWISIFGYIIIAPAYIPCCIACLIIGLKTSKIIREKKLHSYFYYSQAFKFSAIMMTCSCLVNCILDFIYKKIIYLFWALLIVDETLTTSIAIAFFFAALVDLGCLSDKSKCGRILFYLIILTLLIVWTVEIKSSNTKIKVYLYSFAIFVCCGFWVISQFFMLLNSKSCKGFIYLALAGGFGFFGIMCINDMQLYIELCKLFSCYFSGGFFWFLVTPLCIYFIFKYYLATHQHMSKNRYKTIGSTKFSQNTGGDQLIHQEMATLSFDNAPNRNFVQYVYPQVQPMQQLVPVYVPIQMVQNARMQ